MGVSTGTTCDLFALRFRERFAKIAGRTRKPVGGILRTETACDQHGPAEIIVGTCERVGGSIFVYRLSPADVESVRPILEP